MKNTKITSLLMLFILGSSQFVQAYSPLWRYGFSAGTVASSAAVGAAVGRKAAQLCTKNNKQLDKRKNIGTIIGGSIGAVLGTILSYFMCFNKLSSINPNEPSAKSEEQKSDPVNLAGEEKQSEESDEILSRVQSSENPKNDQNYGTLIVHNLTGNNALLTHEDDVQIPDDASDHLNEADLAYEKETLSDLQARLKEQLEVEGLSEDISEMVNFDQVEQAYSELEKLALNELNRCNNALTDNPVSQGNNYIGRVQLINKLYKEICERHNQQQIKRDTHCTMTRRFGRGFENTAK